MGIGWMYRGEWVEILKTWKNYESFSLNHYLYCGYIDKLGIVVFVVVI